VRLFIESPDEHCELGLGDVDGPPRDSELRRGDGSIVRDLRPASGQSSEVSLDAAELAFEPVELQGGGARARVE
jgi:hypothetical protein